MRNKYKAKEKQEDNKTQTTIKDIQDQLTALNRVYRSHPISSDSDRAKAKGINVCLQWFKEHHIVVDLDRVNQSWKVVSMPQEEKPSDGDQKDTS